MFRYPLFLLSTLALLTASAWAQPRITFNLGNGPVYQPGYRQQCPPPRQRVNCSPQRYNQGRNYYQGNRGYGYGYGNGQYNRFRNQRQRYRRNVNRYYRNNRGGGRCR